MVYTSVCVWGGGGIGQCPRIGKVGWETNYEYYFPFLSSGFTMNFSLSPTDLFILFTHTTTSSLLAEAINVEMNMVDE